MCDGLDHEHRFEVVAQGLEPFPAAVTAVYVPAAAGRRIEGRIGPAGLLASDLLDEIPLVMKALREGRVQR